MLGILIVRLVLDPAVGCNDKDDADFEVIICTPLSWRFVIRTLIHDSYLPLHQKVNKFSLLWGEAQLCLPYDCL